MTYIFHCGVSNRKTLNKSLVNPQHRPVFWYKHKNESFTLQFNTDTLLFVQSGTNSDSRLRNAEQTVGASHIIDVSLQSCPITDTFKVTAEMRPDLGGKKCLCNQGCGRLVWRRLSSSTSSSSCCFCSMVLLALCCVQVGFQSRNRQRKKY